MEAFTEKFRAALTCRDVAIRDFYDIDYASRKLDLHIDDGELIRLVKQKLSVPPNVKDEICTLPMMGLYADKSRSGNSEYMKTYFPKMVYKEIPGTGHFLMLEKPQEFNISRTQSFWGSV
jgi:pimeloyl-ACP methyl ester carboxylesterase